MRKKLKKHTYHIWKTAYEGYQKTSWIFYIAALGAIVGNTLSIPIEGGAAASITGFLFFYVAGNVHKKFEVRAR